jgi:drug/metabolite transporter (DMT)-like permease
MDGQPIRPIAMLTLGVAAVSWAAIFVRYCQAPALVVAACRLGLSLIFLIPVYLCSHKTGRRGMQARMYFWIILSGGFLACHFVSWIEAVQRTPIAVAVTLSSTHPIFVGILSSYILKEHLGRGLRVGIVLAVVGTAAMAWSEQGMKAGGWGGYCLALGASLFFSGYLMVGRKVRETVDLMRYVLPTYSTAAFLLLGLVWFFGMPLSGYELRTYVMFFLLAAIPTAIGHSALNWALRYVSASLVAISVLGEPVGATLLAAFLFREHPDVLKVCGGFIILIGIYAAARDTLQRL